MDVATFFSLHALPFAAGATQPPITTPGVRDATAKLMRILGNGAPTALVGGEPGTGKSFLLADLAGRLRMAGVRVSAPNHSRCVNVDLFDLWDYLLIDEADRISGAQLRLIAEAAAARGKHLVAVVGGGTRPLPPPVPLVEVRGLAADEAVEFLRAHLARAGAAVFPFDSAAAKHIADAAGGSARALKSLAGAALVEAMVDDAHAVTHSHAERALANALPGLPQADAPARHAVDTHTAATSATATAHASQRRWLYGGVAALTLTGLVAVAVFRWAESDSPAATVAMPAIGRAGPDAVDTDATAPVVSKPSSAPVAAVADDGIVPTLAIPELPVAAISDPRSRARVIVRYAGSGSPVAAETGYALAGMLERGGWRIAGVQPTANPPAKARLRYFTAADRAAAQALMSAAASPEGGTLEMAERAGAPGTLEFWLPADRDAGQIR